MEKATVTNCGDSLIPGAGFSVAVDASAIGDYCLNFVQHGCMLFVQLPPYNPMLLVLVMPRVPVHPGPPHLPNHVKSTPLPHTFTLY